MKENLGNLFLATVLVMGSLLLILPTVTPYPLQQHPELGPEGSLAAQQSNSESELNKEPGTYISPSQSNMDARMRLYLLSWLQNVGALQNFPNSDYRTKAKRTCRLNAGLSHSCDYKDTLDAIHEGMYLGSDMTPGKK